MPQDLPDSWTKTPSKPEIVMCLQEVGILPSDINARTLAQSSTLTDPIHRVRVSMQHLLKKKKPVTKRDILEAAELIGIGRE